MYGGHLLRLNLFILELPSGSFPIRTCDPVKELMTINYILSIKIEHEIIKKDIFASRWLLWSNPGVGIMDKQINKITRTLTIFDGFPELYYYWWHRGRGVGLIGNSKMLRKMGSGILVLLHIWLFRSNHISVVWLNFDKKNNWVMIPVVLWIHIFGVIRG